MLTTREAEVVGQIDEGRLLHDLDGLIRIQSLGGYEEVAQRWMASRLRHLGFETDVWEIDFDALRSHSSFSMEVERRTGVGVVGTLGDGPRTALALNGHVDVVPIGDSAQWSVDPWRATVRGGRVYGRGACDMKGGLAAGLAAIAALQGAGIRLEQRLMFHSVVAEEDGGAGTLATLARGHLADAAVSMEPTELAVAPAHAGALSFRVRVPGLATHGAVREEGVSAIEKFEAVHHELLALEERRNRRLAHPLFARYARPFALSIGRISAGDWPSSVPDLLMAEGRYGIAPGEDAEAARQELETAVLDAASGDPWLREHPPSVEWWGGQFVPAMTASDASVVNAAQTAFRDVAGRAAHVEGMTYGADMRLLVNEGGIPTILFGPGNVRQAHRADEYVPREDLLIVSRTLALMAMRMCGGR